MNIADLTPLTFADIKIGMEVAEYSFSRGIVLTRGVVEEMTSDTISTWLRIRVTSGDLVTSGIRDMGLAPYSGEHMHPSNRTFGGDNLQYFGSADPTYENLATVSTRLMDAIDAGKPIDDQTLSDAAATARQASQRFSK